MKIQSGAMNSLPTPDTFPLGQSGAKKSKDSGLEEKRSKKEKKRLTKSSPGPIRNAKPKSHFPKVALAITPKTPKTPKTKKKSPKNSRTSLPLTSNKPVVHTRSKTPIKQIELNEKSSPIKEIKVEATVKRPENVDIEWKNGIKWVLGKLAWARVGNFPFWPCVVTLEPKTMIYYRVQQRANGSTNFIHVQYFGDNERHSWVSEINIFPFNGPDDFEKQGLELLISKFFNNRKFDSKFKSAFSINSTHRAKWEIAVSEATEILGITDKDRASIFAPAPSVIKPSSSSKKKRKLSNTESQSEVPKKKFKSNVVPNGRVQTPKVQKSKDEPKIRKNNVKSEKNVGNLKRSKSLGNLTRINGSFSKSTSNLTKINGDLSKSNSNLSTLDGALIKINSNLTKINGNLSKSNSNLTTIDGNLTKINNKFSKSVMNLSKIFEKSSKPNGKLNKDFEKSHKVNGKLYKELEKPLKFNGKLPKPAKHCKVETYDSFVQTPPTPPSSLLNNSWDEEKKILGFDILMEIEDDIKKELWSESIQENEDSSNLSNSEQDNSSSDDFEPEKKFEKTFEKKRKSKSQNEESTGNSNKGKAKKFRPLNLFKGIKQERVCQLCEQTGKLVKCKGTCFSYYHLSCAKPEEMIPELNEEKNTSDVGVLEDWIEIREKIAETENSEVKVEEQQEEEFKCIDCLSGIAPDCFICKDRENDRIRCSAVACGRYYHPACLKTWPQSHWQGGRLTCPNHMCHTCNSDNPQNGHVGKTNEKLARCVRCPSAYHASSSCLPAGSEILTGSQVICPKHYKSTQPPLNATWCFLCTKGGSLICCDTCPTSFHPECLGIKAPDGAFICEDCETGRLPLYGEIVWVKLGNYRWWPSRICFPYEIPLNVAAMKHKVGQFCVMFLGTRNFYWVHRGRAFLYQEGDACNKTSGRNKLMDEAFKKALKEASEFHQLWKKQKAATKDQERGLKPPPYVRLKVNKPVGNAKPIEVESIVACVCSPHLDNPCAPDMDCLNRMLCVECSPDICPAGTKCQNQAFVQRLYPAMEPFHTNGKGWGLRSLEPIKSGQFVIEYVGEVIDEAEYKRRLQRKKELKNENYYFLTIDTGRMIDAEPKGNLSRFMNHSCQPNCETQKWTVNGDTRIGLFALRDIESGEELTFNYNLACDGEERKPCLCGAPNCSGFIGLKVQKQQISAIQEKKTEKTDKLKTDKSKPDKPKPDKSKPDEPKQLKKQKKMLCFGCKRDITTENSIRCKQKSCSRRYHKRCVMKDLETRFICPWHICAECDRQNTSRCSVCKIAFCGDHVSKNLVEVEGTLVCKNHQNGLTLSNSLIRNEKLQTGKLDMAFGKRSISPWGSSSPILSKKSLIKNEEQSSRVSIVEVYLSSEENDECLIDDTYDSEDSSKISKETTSSRRSIRKEKRKLEALNALNSEELLAIIGGNDQS